MKGKLYLLTGLFLGLAIGWALGFLRFPYLEKNDSFFIGFATALTAASLLLIFVKAWNRNPIFALPDNKVADEATKSKGRDIFWWLLLLGGLLAGGWWGARGIQGQNQSFRAQIQSQDNKLREMAALVESVKQSDMGPLLHSILEDVGEELKMHPKRKLSDATLSRIQNLCQSFHAYRQVEADSLSEQAFSPGRGQLLLALALMRMDTGTFGSIKRSVDFSGADLRGADLKGVDLSGINLQEANFKDADLSGASLEGANLSGAKFWETKMNQANLNAANLSMANLSWAQLNGATLRKANLSGANLANAQLIKSDLSGATFRWGQLVGVLFNEANLTGVSLLGTDLAKANFSQANLSYTDIRLINLSEAIIVGTEFSMASVDEKWPEKLAQWRPTGMKELQDHYAVVNDSISTADKRKIFHLRKKD